jgi:P27 family predicted phage terminase small subunit
MTLKNVVLKSKGMPVKPVNPPSSPVPAGLSRESGEIWQRVTTEYDIRDSAGLEVLRVGLEAHDRYRQAQTAIDKDGASIKDRWGQTKPHPLLACERDARAQFLAAMKQLNFDIEPLRDRVGRPGR